MRSIAFTFPGQGSQRPGMGAAWVEHPSWELVEEASEVAGCDVARLLLEADADELRLTKNAQVATFVTSLLALDAVERVGLVPAACAGHSLGEYTALAATGALTLADGVRVVAARGEAMQRAADDRPGTMAAVLGLDDDDADAACRRADGDVWVANFNGPGQVVVAGTAEGVAAAGVAAKDLGARKVLALPVGGAFHTPLMAPARDDLRKALDAAAWHAPDVPVVANVDARPHGGDEEWTSLLSAQLCSPVRWRQSIGRLVADGIDSFVELGPGGVLTGMAKRIAPEARALTVTSPDDLDALLESLAGEPGPTPDTSDGEHLYVTERLVVSPGAGAFRLHGRWLTDAARTDAARTDAARTDAARTDASTARVEVGDVLGTVGSHEVRSLFAGTFMGPLALEGERVTPSQPVAWLQVEG